MTARLYYEVRGHRAPVDELLTRTSLQRFVDLEDATREQLGGDGLTFGDVRDYLARVLNAKSDFELVSTLRDILLYRAIAWLVIIQTDKQTPFAEVGELAVGDLTSDIVGLPTAEDADPKDAAEEQAPAI